MAATSLTHVSTGQIGIACGPLHPGGQTGLVVERAEQQWSPEELNTQKADSKGHPGC